MGLLVPAMAQHSSINLTQRWERASTPFLNLSVAYDKLERPYFYVTAKVGGLQIFDASDPDNPVLAKTVMINEFADLHVMNLFQQGTDLFLALGGHFGGQTEYGMGIVDVSDPANAIVTDFWHGDNGKGSGIVVADGDYAYLGAMTLGVIIFDISDKSDIQFVSQFVPDINYPTPNPANEGTFNARGMTLRGNILYVCYDAGGLRILDVSDKASPRQLGQYANPALAGRPTAYNNIAVAGNLAYVPIDYCGLEIIDISNPENMVTVGWWDPWECVGGENIWFNSDGHTNEIVLLEDEGLVFLSSADSELSVLDISDPAEPRLVGSFGELDDGRGTWGLTVHNNQVYLTYITALIPFFSNWTGIRLVDWSTAVGVAEQPVLPDAFVLDQNYPNPFTPNTTIPYTLRQSSPVQIEVFSLLGQKIATLIDAYQIPGSYAVRWNGQDDAGQRVTSGLYVYRMHVGAFQTSRMMVFIQP